MEGEMADKLAKAMPEEIGITAAIWYQKCEERLEEQLWSLDQLALRPVPRDDAREPSAPVSAQAVVRIPVEILAQATKATA